jgi:opacity protein-like surface antigen
MKVNHTAIAAGALVASMAGAWAQNAPAPAPAASDPALPALAAQATPAPMLHATGPRLGPYIIAAAGGTDYEYDCFFFSCDKARGSTGKLGLGYRIGVFGVEAWWAELGKANTNNPAGSVQQRTLGVSAVWTARFGERFEGYLRTGAADLRQTRVRNGVSETTSSFEPTFGLGIGLLLAPQASVELAWDITRNKDDVIGDVVSKTVTLGVRLRF